LSRFSLQVSTQLGAAPLQRFTNITKLPKTVNYFLQKKCGEKQTADDGGNREKETTLNTTFSTIAIAGLFKMMVDFST
jgi:hypothetical protein